MADRYEDNPPDGDDDKPTFGERFKSALKIGLRGAVKWGLILGGVALGASVLMGGALGAGAGGAVGSLVALIPGIGPLIAPLGITAGATAGATMGAGAGGVALAALGGLTKVGLYGGAFGFIWNAAEELLTGKEAQEAKDEALANKERAQIRQQRTAALRMRQRQQAVAMRQAEEQYGLSPAGLPGRQDMERGAGV